MNEKVTGAISRVLWAAILTGIIMVFSTVVMLTQYHGTPHMYILAAGLGVAAGFAVVIVFGRWSLPIAVIVGLLGFFVFHVATGTLIAACVGFVLAYAVLMRWSHNDRHRRHRYLST